LATGGFIYLARWPPRQAAQHARDRIRFLTMRARPAAPVEQVVRDINVFLRGWAGSSVAATRPASLTRSGSTRRCASPVLPEAAQTRPGRGLAWGFAQVYRSRDALGLIDLNGIIVAPKPNRAWRAPVERRR